MATLIITSSGAPAAEGQPPKYPTSYRTIVIDGLSIFYREAGPKDGPSCAGSCARGSSLSCRLPRLGSLTTE
jgi:hypothetical protein